MNFLLFFFHFSFPIKGLKMKNEEMSLPYNPHHCVALEFPIFNFKFLIKS